jgi:hypothetical protein
MSFVLSNAATYFYEGKRTSLLRQTTKEFYLIGASWKDCFNPVNEKFEEGELAPRHSRERHSPERQSALECITCD